MLCGLSTIVDAVTQAIAQRWKRQPHQHATGMSRLALGQAGICRMAVPPEDRTRVNALGRDGVRESRFNNVPSPSFFEAAGSVRAGNAVQLVVPKCFTGHLRGSPGTGSSIVVTMFDVRVDLPDARALDRDSHEKREA
jgi:hypothetical protein